MRLKRVQSDFRVTELLRDEASLKGKGPYELYRVTKRGLTTFEAADRIAQEAGVDRTDVTYAGLKDKDGITGQYMTVAGGRAVKIKEPGLAIFHAGGAVRALNSEDSIGNAFEIMVRDLGGDDMRRIRVNIEEVKRHGLPNYFDDQRFGCLRHGQGFVVRHLMKGDVEAALHALLAAPSPFGSEHVERYKQGITRRWGDWEALTAFARGNRGSSAFEHLHAKPRDFAGALERGVASREKTIHLFAYQSHLWNRALALRAQQVTSGPDLAWLPGDAGGLPVWRSGNAEALAGIAACELPLLGKGAELSAESRRLYEAVMRSEGFSIEQFIGLDHSGFRPLAELRPTVIRPEFLRAAPAELDEMHRLRRKMRLRFTLGRGQYATLVCKRLLMPTDPGYRRLRLWVSRHAMEFPDDTGSAPPPGEALDEHRRRDDQRNEPRNEERYDDDRRRPEPYRQQREHGPRGDTRYPRW
ncbi:MAG: tRNA pseudouridine(13) synthase TruD [Planctomycetota bacterium]|nr:tRNA pseudouridine(13) synthase TruD [Planctomycetota bacterium]